MPSAHSAVLIFGFCIVFVISFHMDAASDEIFWPCKQCSNPNECNAPPVETCVWGEARDACDRRVCAKGPGERCGGPLNLLGECGEGMMCKNERCHGCSIETLQCHP